MEEATRVAFSKALVDYGDQYPEIVTIDADLSGSTKTRDFAKKFSNRAFNVGISEQDLIGTAAGFAIAGKRPFACSFAIFATGRAWEQIRNTICTSNLPVVIVGTHAGIFTGEDGETHQSLEDVAVLRSIANIKIFSPADAVETKQVVKHILDYEKGPCYLRLGREPVSIIFNENENLQIDKIKVLQNGNNMMIFATGPLVYQALLVSKKLADRNIHAGVANVCQLSPIDRIGIINTLREIPFCVTCEDHSVTGALGSAIAEIIAEEGLDTKLLRIGMRHFGESGTPQDLYHKYGFDSEGLVQSIEKFLGNK